MTLTLYDVRKHQFASSPDWEEEEEQYNKGSQSNAINVQLATKTKVYLTEFCDFFNLRESIHNILWFLTLRKFISRLKYKKGRTPWEQNYINFFIPPVGDIPEIDEECLYFTTTIPNII